MATTNRDRVGQAMDLLKAGLTPYVVREMQAANGRGWFTQVQQVLAGRRSQAANYRTPDDLDVQALLDLMRDRWSEVFARQLGNFERNLVHELSSIRNRWAHQEQFSSDDAYRALDSAGRLLAATGAAEQSAEIERDKQELLRVRYDEQTRRETRKAAVAPVEGRPAGGIRPWREIVTPHPDVASGRYQQAEFAADLSQVHRGEGAAEYRDPAEFFRRTFLTEGLRHLLVGALRRIAGTGGDPIIELQTNFGGGKTHSMLALYHLFSGAPAGQLPGVEDLLRGAGAAPPAEVRRAVLVGTALSPAQPRRKPDGIETRTFWGELAWQLGGRDGYTLVAEADQTGVSPGSEALRDLFEMFGPCLILIDEWVAFVRQLYGVDGLPAGSFDANLTFAQSLTEAARQVPGALVVASIPSSDIEIGGQGGREALDRLRNTFGRMESPWRPASAEEGFEIVRRRLFEPIADPNAFAQRDAAVRGFMDLYRTQSGEFPAQCREGDYERRLRDAYPVHPELFDRLYTDWSTLDKFQRTRGVLRLMAAVIHTLWMRQDTGLLIMPASVPVDDPAVQFELTRYMDDPWVPVIEKDVDGPNALPLRLDGANPNFGRYSACRRVARTLYLGSAPTMHTARRGLEDRSIKLGCTQPGESVATFGDALRRLSDEATHLYVDAGRYWFSTQQNVNRTAADRAAQQDPDEVAEEIRRRVRENAKQRGDFARVHPCPPSGVDVPDDHEARLVILGPEHPHAARSADSPARQAAATILDARGTGPRIQRNALVFLAPDRTRLAELEQAVRQYLAWTSIDAERETLNLDAFQAGQARTKMRQMDDTVDRRIPETYSWLLVPEQDVNGPVEWEEFRLQGDEPLAIRASKKLKNEGRLATQYGWANLRLELDRIPLWRGDHVTLRQLWDDFAQYLYLPRLRDSEVLLHAVQEGTARMFWESESFAYAERWDEDRGRYIGLRTGEGGAIALDGGTVIVKPEAARRQIDADEAARRRQEGQDAPYLPVEQFDATTVRDGEGAAYGTDDRPSIKQGRARLGRFHGAVALNPQRASRDAGTIAEEVLAHLTGLVGARAEVTLEIHVDLPDDVPDHVVRTVTENCRTLKFTTFGFEEK
ncbi:MAG: Swt1 family HEPN domain-containing protein [Dehalococcoidia bacterium]